MKQDKSTKMIIEAWIRYEETLESISPLTYATLLGGATEADFAECEKTLELKLPAEVRAFYSRHNGESPTDQAADGVFDYGYFLPLNGAESACEESLIWDELLRYPNAVPPQMEGRQVSKEMTKYWLTFAKDYAGNSLIVDCNPGIAGTAGEVYFYDHEASPELSLVASNLAEFLESERLKLGKRSEPEGEVDEGYLDELEDEDLDEEELVVPRPRPRPVRREIEDRPWLELTVRLPQVLGRVLYQPIQTATMKEMDLVIEFVSVKTVTELAAKRGLKTELEPNRYVAITVYSGTEPARKFLEGYGGDGDLSDGKLFRGESVLESSEHGLLHVPIKGGTEILPVFYWRLPEPPNEDVGLMFDLKRRKPA